MPRRPGTRTQFMLISPEAAIVESQRAYATTLRTVGQQGKFLHDSILADRLGVIAGRLPNSRASEAEADRIGIELAARAGYDPAAGASLWRKMQALQGWVLPEFLRTHPSPGNRAQTLAALAPAMWPLMPATPPRPLPVEVLP